MFDVVHHGPAGDLFLDRQDVEDIGLRLGMQVAPIVAIGTLGDMERLVHHGMLRSQWGDFEPEGIVARPKVELRTRRGDRVIAKLKTKDFPLPPFQDQKLAA